jgi:hypothetical protein
MTMTYNPLTISNIEARQAMLFIRRYVAKHSQPDCHSPLSPEAREEVAARIIYDWQTADYSEWTPESHQHAAASHGRRWRLRGWHGNTADEQALRRFEAKLAKQRQAEGWDATPSTGTSEDSQTPTPLAILIAKEEAGKGLRYVSDRQRKARRKAIRGRNRIERWLVVEGRYETHTAIRWEEAKIYGVSYKGTVPNRQIGKSRTAAVPEGLAGWAMLGRDERGRFVPSRKPVTASPWTVAELANRTTWRAKVD